MSTKNTYLFILSIVAASGAAGQTMYKVIGPDGKVTFSDRPQRIETARQMSILKGNISHAVPIQAPVAAPAAVAAPGRKASPAVPGAPAVVTAEVEDAIVSVMTQAEFPRRFYQFCSATAASSKEFTLAAKGWRQRNHLAVEHQEKLVMLVLGPAKRTQLQEETSKAMTEELRKVAARNPTERLAWCAGIVAELTSTTSDINQPAMMAVPIIPFRRK